MRRAGLASLVSSALLLASALAAHAGSLVTPPIPINNAASERAACSVMNGTGRTVGPLTIRILRLVGSEVASQQVDALAADNTAELMVDAVQIDIASTVSCMVEGKGVGRRTPVSFCTLPAATYACSTAVQAP